MRTTNTQKPTPTVSGWQTTQTLKTGPGAVHARGQRKLTMAARLGLDPYSAWPGIAAASTAADHRRSRYQRRDAWKKPAPTSAPPARGPIILRDGAILAVNRYIQEIADRAPAVQSQSGDGFAFGLGGGPREIAPAWEIAGICSATGPGPQRAVSRTECSRAAVSAYAHFSEVDGTYCSRQDFKLHVPQKVPGRFCTNLAGFSFSPPGSLQARVVGGKDAAVGGVSVSILDASSSMFPTSLDDRANGSLRATPAQISNTAIQICATGNPREVMDAVMAMDDCDLPWIDTCRIIVDPHICLAGRGEDSALGAAGEEGRAVVHGCMVMTRVYQNTQLSRLLRRASARVCSAAKRVSSDSDGGGGEQKMESKPIQEKLRARLARVVMWVSGGTEREKRVSLMCVFRSLNLPTPSSIQVLPPSFAATHSGEGASGGAHTFIANFNPQGVFDFNSPPVSWPSSNQLNTLLRLSRGPENSQALGRSDVDIQSISQVGAGGCGSGSK